MSQEIVRLMDSGPYEAGEEMINNEKIYVRNEDHSRLIWVL
jgi:hypothetical protein